MIHQYSIVILAVFISSGLCAYQPIQFIAKPSPRNARLSSSYSTVTIHSSPKSRSSRSFGHVIGTYPQDNVFWQNGIYLTQTPFTGAGVEVGQDGHITPDFSDGLAYPDPYLITGPRAVAITKLLYSHEMFYNDYPHVSALLKNQQLRRENGLEEHRLGSIRPSSPFHNYRLQYVYLS